METLKFGYKYFKKSIPLAVFAEILSFLGIYAELLFPLLLGILVDYCIQSNSVEAESGGMFHFLLTGKYGEVHSMELFFSVAILFGIMVLLRIVLIYIRDLIQEWIGLRLETDLRYATYDKLMKLDSQTISDYNSGELLQILNSDTILFKEIFAHRLAYFGDSIFMIITTLILVAGIDIRFVLIPLILTPFLIRTVMTFKRQARVNFKEIRDRSADLNLAAQENIAGVRIVRSFTNEDLEEEKFDTVNQNFYDARIDQIRISSKFDMSLNSLKQLAYISSILIGAVLVMGGQLSIGYILASSTYVLRLMNNITSINNHIFIMQQQMVSGLELQHFMEKESRVPDEEDSKLRSDTPNIVLEDVGLTIDGQEILKSISLDIPYGKKVGIVGETGSGKSVLLKTLSRERDITSGNIRIDGHDIKEYSLKNLRNMFSYVYQDVFLFSNTIASNIAFSNPEADQKVIREAAVHAQADSFIHRLSEQYKTIVGERGIGISGGQKQRVSIARAFLKNAPIFVLDDSTSALDTNTEKTLLKDIRENFADKTVIITAHRFSSVVDCDEILYMKDGQITERGTFQQLMELGGSFAHVYHIQMMQKENRLEEQQGGAMDGQA